MVYFVFVPPILITSVSAARRLERAEIWISERAAAAELLLLGGSTEGIHDLTRAITQKRGAVFGWHRMTLRGLALRLAERELLARELRAASSLAIEALWTRVVHDLSDSGKLGRFRTVARQPGLPRALARTVEELRLGGRLAGPVDPDLAAAQSAFEAALSDSRLADRALVLRFAIEELRSEPVKHPLAALPVLLLDVAIQSTLEEELITAVTARAEDTFMAVPFGDERTVRFLERSLAVVATRDDPPANTGLSRLQRHLFAQEPPPLDQPADDVELLSAPGESRECIELARHLQREMGRGTPLDRMAVLLRAPGAYRSPICEALRRANIPAYFARGTRLPDPAGRALLSLLACADEGLSARQFNEYLSLGEVPKATAEGLPPVAPPAGERWAPADGESDEAHNEVQAILDGPPEPDEFDDAAPVVLGTLRAPRRWELLVLEAAVIGGHDRWKRRLAGLAARYRLELSAPDISEANAARITKSLSDLEAFTAYALPLIELLASLPRRANWSEWLERLTELASRSLRTPTRVLAVLAELAPLGSVGPVSLAEVRAVLSDRLRDLTSLPPKRRFGRVFVGPVETARGMAFDVVLVPGLAERVFPQKVREDPLLPDAERRRVSPSLETDADRVASERLQLQLAVGAAKHRVVLSYPRIDASEARPRVPSFYGLEALRAIEGRLPRYEELRRRAERAVDARIGWPAPRDPSTAIDISERDLSVLDGLFRGSTPLPRGAARYLTQVNPFLARSLRMRYARWHSAWTQSDGLVKPSAEAIAALALHQLRTRAFSATALQHFAACPYRFYLSTILKLSPWEEPVAIEELDPLQKGSMVHEVHYGILSKLRDRSLLPLGPSHLERALTEVDAVLEEVALKHEELYAPSIDRVWRDGLVAMRADAREWLRRMAAESTHWTPWKFELAFGLGSREQHDPESRQSPVELDGGLRLRGSIDLVERSSSGQLRATDYKTGKARVEPGTVLGGGKTLQPVLYALALEKLFPGAAVVGGRLHYCTQAGEFSEVSIPLDRIAREAAKRATNIVSDALVKGFFPAAPAKDECTYCDYRAVCGLREERRVAIKPKAELRALLSLREIE